MSLYLVCLDDGTARATAVSADGWSAALEKAERYATVRLWGNGIEYTVYRLRAGQGVPVIADGVLAGLPDRERLEPRERRIGRVLLDAGREAGARRPPARTAGAPA